VIDNYTPSILLTQAIAELSKLPGIGKKTALRLVLYMLKWNITEIEKFSNAFIQLKNNIKYCKKCYNISDTDICSICTNPKRNHKLVCIVESIREIIAIEQTAQYNGLYHVLGGIISPMEGIGPNNLSIDALENRVQNEGINEIIFALSTTMEGDTTCFYISRKLSNYQLKFTSIARGVAFGGDLEYTDEITLGQSIANRNEYKKEKL